MMMDRYNLSTGLYDVQQEVPYLRYVLVAVFFIPCALIIFVGNTFVLMAYMRDRRIRENTTNVYILSLALADLLVGVVMVIFAPMYLSTTWRFGGSFCVVAVVLNYTATDMSVITIVTISVDRYYMVHNSLRHRSRQSYKRVTIICSIMWLTCLAVHLTLAFTFSAKTGFLHAEDRIAICDLGYGKNLVVLVMTFVVEFLLPAVCVFSLNLIVYLHLKRRADNGLQTAQSRDHRSSAVSLDDRLPQTPLGNDDMRIHGRASGCQHQKAARFLALLLTVFVICWLPFYIEDCYTYVHLSGVHNEAYNNVVSFILWMNSAINPFLYAFTNVFFKENFVHFLTCFRRK